MGHRSPRRSPLPLSVKERATASYRITNGFAIGSLDRFIQMVFGRV